jgi:hypothetical protein
MCIPALDGGVPGPSHPALPLAELADDGDAGGASTPNAKRLLLGRPLALGGAIGIAVWMGEGV